MPVLFATLLSACGAKTGLLTPDAVSPHADASQRDVRAPSDAADRVEPLDVVTARDVLDAADAATGFDARDNDTAFDTNDETAASIAASLDGLRWELPCISSLGATVCTTPASQHVATVLGGPPGAEYAAVLRFRGVVELKGYQGGIAQGTYWQIGGQPDNDTINVYSLTLSSPPQQYFLNRVTVDVFACTAIDYEETVTLDTGSAVSLDADSIDGRELRNLDTTGQPIVVPGVPPAPAPYDGQFIQMDVVSLTRIR